MSDFTIETIKECSKNDKEIYGFARIINKAVSDTLTHLVFLTIYGAQTKTEVTKILCDRETFVCKFIEVFKNSKLKAFIFQIDGTPENVDFIRCIRLNLVLTDLFKDIPYIFVSTEEQMRSAILIESDVAVKVGERIIEVLIDDNGYVVSELEYTKQGYLECEQRDCKPYKKMTAETIRQRILGSNDPVKIVCHANLIGMESTKFLTNKVLNMVPSSKLIVLEENLDKYNGKFVFETIKWMFDKSYIKFYVCQKSFRNYMIIFKYGGKQYPLIVCKKHDVLPFNKTITIPRSFLEFAQAHTDNNDIDILENRPLEISTEIHALKFSLEIDESNFSFADVRGLIFNKISRLPAQLEAQELKIPVIGFYGEISFMYVKNDNSGFKLLDSWNGKLGKDLYISFDEEKPKFFEKAVNKFLSHGNSVYHDIIKVMSISPSKLSSTHESFGYTVSSDADHPVLMIVENNSGEKKSASPAFLMALLLKQHLKELKRVLGKIPNKIGFCLFDDFDNDADAKKRVENGLKKSCQMLKELECCFIEAV